MTQASSKIRVLVVEDNEDVRNIISIYLKRNGYIVTEAVDGIVALESLDKFRPDVIILDVLLPRLDGIETLKKIRESEIGHDTPVIMMSAVLQTKDLQAETARHDVSSFLQKPFQMRTLIDHIKDALTRKKRKPPAAGAKAGVQKGQRVQMKRQPFVPSGKLEEMSIPEILHAVFVESRTGQLQIYSENTDKRVFFQNGIPVYAESSLPEETLGAHLVRKRKINQTQHNKALAQMTRTGRHFGEVLLKLGLLGPHELFTEIESHLMSKVISIFGWTHGTYQFEDGDNWKDDVIVARMAIGRILLDGIQKHWHPEKIQNWLKISDTSQVYPLEDSAYSEEQLGLSTQEARVLQMARRGCTVIDITRQLKDLNMVTGTLFALFIMGHIGFVIDSTDGVLKPLTASQSSETVASGDERAKALLGEYIKLRTADYFTLLGVSRDATDKEISLAFKTRQQRYHPDTLVGIDTGLVHEKVEELYVRLHNAYRTLIDAGARQRYVERLEKKADTASMAVSRPRTRPTSSMPAKKRDVMLFDEGSAALRNGKFERARELFAKAMEESPSVRYEAYMTWATYLTDPKENKEKAEKTLNKLLDENPREVLLPYLLGNMALREKESKKAADFFTTAIKIDPQHIDSARQLRLLRMRQRKTETSGLFDLFKKKPKPE